MPQGEQFLDYRFWLYHRHVYLFHQQFYLRKHFFRCEYYSGLNIDISDLLTSTENQTPRTRHGFTRKGKGKIHETDNYIYETLCNGIVNKKMIPIVTRIKSHSLEQFGEIMRHSGEEFFFVLEGTVELITEHYASVKLEQGDCAYFDSSMGHACLSADEKDAVILWVSTPN